MIFLILLIYRITGLTQTASGGWRDYLPYSNGIKIVKIGNLIYCATKTNIFTYNTSDNSIDKLSKITGLSDMGISTMEYDPEYNLLLIAYSDGNLDILKNNIITNIPDLKNKVLNGSKSANQIFFKNNFAYISYPFGIIVVDLEKEEIKDTYIIGDAATSYEVMAVTADSSTIYAATTRGVFRASLNDPFLVDYSHWQRITSFPDSYGTFDQICTFDGKVIVNYASANDSTDQLYYMQNDQWYRFLFQATMHKYEMRVWNNKLFITGNFHVYQIGTGLKIENEYTYDNPKSTLMDTNGNIWFADGWVGLLLHTAGSGDFRSITPSGPLSTDAYNLQFQNGTLYVSGGGVNQTWVKLYTHGEIFEYSNNTWTNIFNQDAFDYVSITPDPSDPNKIYANSWGQGIFVYENNKLTKNYTYTNSSLQTALPGQDFVLVGGSVFDAQGNMWMTNSRVNTSLVVHKTDGTWKTFSLSNYIQAIDVGSITIDKGGRLWVVLPRGYGLFVYDPNGTVDDQSDDRYIKFKPKSIYGDIISNIYCTTVDNDGAVWVGTDQGVVVYSSPDQVFNGQTDGYQPAIPRNDGKNTVDPLLGGQRVNCIAVDGANQKWIGTQSGGAYLVSADGTKQILNFNTSNSPIFSNQINSIAINGQTGEVYFATDKGIESYRATATTGADNFGKAYVYPDPVRDDYHGNITITGLMTNTTVKITDISGNLVYETKSVGGQAVWNGNLPNGKRVATGVYLVFLSNEDGTKSFVTKMLVIH